MATKQRKKLTSWIFVYAALILAVVFANRSDAVTPPELGSLSPVVLGGDAPSLKVDSIVRRSDI